MDKMKLAALGERLKTGGERLKVGGAEMGRKFSGKMKEILQGQSREAKMVEEATSDTLEEPNWGLNLRICNFLNSEEFDGSEVVRAIKKKIASKSPMSQLLSLDLLEACAMNCDKVFSEVASEKVLEEMVKMIDDPQTNYGNRKRALQLIEAWGKSDDLSYLPVFKQTYMNLRSKEGTMVEDDGHSTQIFSTLEPDFVGQESLTDGHPFFGLDQQPTDEDLTALHGMPLSIEEKRELLAITRNSMEITSSLLKTEAKEKPVKDELLMSMVEKCRESQPFLQRVIETTTDDESLLFEALNLHDELEQVMATYSKLEGDSVASEEEGGGSSTEKKLVRERSGDRKVVDLKKDEDFDDSGGGSGVRE
ncbi:hypothetical protein AXF42_Ash000840 [Apostasia shenzhenica]|uniref:TOM1-like protein 2 n=1 Tax=Apostasia shenzhenica TaxID=1088818 RepID=A0A2I0AT76_9ASPA|nr:hypothetical protein AXF42_Ash000840 [Apostasia shenzhenica]